MASSTVALVSGANTGIGYEIVKALLQSSKTYQVFLGSRSTEKGKAAIEQLQKEVPDAKSTVESLELDLVSDASIDHAYEFVKAKTGRLDVLVNNAGANFDIDHVKGKVSLRESFTKAYDVNVAGTNVLTHALMPLLLKSEDPRLLFISGLSGINAASRSYYPTPPQPAGWPKKIDFETIAYRCTKCALNMLTVDWDFKLRADGVKVWAVAPGMLATNLGGVSPDLMRELGAGHPSEGGDLVRRIIEGERDGDTGKFVGKDGAVREW